ncbi:MAG TPA: GntR family transcriptional regulator [Casimicrobiaceae bacterium]|nr:GntR family transcriptional regulator [Casimicrobiaceae bacterium]
MHRALPDVDEPRTKEELAYEDLKVLILSGQLPKDEFLSQRMLAQRVGTNITTVRTALRQLENDGLLENVPQWGVRIPVETEERLRDLYFMRELLEMGAVRRCVQNRDTVDVALIMAKAKRCDSLARKLPENVVAFSQAHFDFHLELAKQSGSELLVQNLNRVHFRSWLLWHDVRLWKRRNLVDHEKLVNVMFSTSEDDAAEAILRHIEGGLQAELAELRKTLDKGGAGRPRTITGS